MVAKHLNIFCEKGGIVGNVLVKSRRTDKLTVVYNPKQEVLL